MNEEPEIEIPNPVGLSQVAQLFHYSKETVYGWRSDPRFPKPDAKRQYDIFRISYYLDLLELEKMDAAEYHEFQVEKADRVEELLNSGQLEGLERNVRKVIFKMRHEDPETARLEAIADLEAQVRGV